MFNKGVDIVISSNILIWERRTMDPLARLSSHGGTEQAPRPPIARRFNINMDSPPTARKKGIIAAQWLEFDS